MPEEKATSVPWRYLFFLSTSYAAIPCARKKSATASTASVNILSGAETVFAQLLHERGAPHPQKSRRLGHSTAGFLERFADESDFNRRQVILEVNPAARQCGVRRLRP